jgi:hypothetical protein
MNDPVKTRTDVRMLLYQYGAALLSKWVAIKAEDWAAVERRYQEEQDAERAILAMVDELTMPLRIEWIETGMYDAWGQPDG